jgi:hypothetical protein
MSNIEVLTQKLKVNLLSLVCSMLLLLSPFLSWINLASLVVANGALLTGFAVQSSLLDIADQHAGISLSQNIVLSSQLSLVFLIIGGVISLRKAKIGLLIATIGLMAFVLESHSLFGKEQNGAITTYSSVGIGFFVAMTGVLWGAFSMMQERKPIRVFISHITSKEGLTKLGLVLSTITIVLDALNHTSLGQIPTFLGSSYIEMMTHLGFLLSIGCLFFAFTYKKNLPSFLPLQAIVMIPLLFLISDAVYHFLNHRLIDFVGHNSVEMSLHFLTYYGIALVIVGNLLVKRRGEIIEDFK